MGMPKWILKRIQKNRVVERKIHLNWGKKSHHFYNFQIVWRKIFVNFDGWKITMELEKIIRSRKRYGSMFNRGQLDLRA